MEKDKEDSNFRDSDQSTLVASGFRPIKYRADDKKQRQLVASVAMNLVVDCDLPMHIVTRPGFIRHHEMINSQYNTINK